MKTFLDILLIIISTYYLIKSGIRIAYNRSKSIADYAFVVIYVFNVLPIVLDYVVGAPEYGMYSWWSGFAKAYVNETVGIVYSIFMILTVISIGFYLRRQDKKSRIGAAKEYIEPSSLIFRGPILLIIALSPIVWALANTNLSSLLVFTSATNRGTGNIGILMFLELAGMYSFFCWFFTERKRPISYAWLVLYCFILAWVDGKRYLVVVMAMLFVYFYNNSSYSRKKKIPMRFVIIVGVVGLLAFYSIYALTYRVTGTVNDSNIVDTMYLSFRIDFGRDDVTKFVLYRELIEDNPILEYRGQSLLSTLFWWIPRSVWPSKPYPHYRYLTAALYNTTVHGIPAGMTPSVFEMGIANFGVYFGIPLTIFAIIMILYAGDQTKTVPRKVLFLILVESLLTQSLDAILFVLIAIFLTGLGKNIRITIGHREISGIRSKDI